MEFVTAEYNNKMMELGYRFMARGDYKVLDTIEPRSGMPDIESSVHFFKTEEEAKEYASKQVYPFSGQFGSYERLVHRETKTEAEAKEKAAKEKRKATIAKKAFEAGMTVEEYYKDRAKKATKSRLEREIEELKAELARKEAALKELG